MKSNVNENLGRTIYDGEKANRFLLDEAGQWDLGKPIMINWEEFVPKIIKTPKTKKPRFTFDRSDGFVLGIAIDSREVQFGLTMWILTVKFRR
jgi:hypothetical protein